MTPPVADAMLSRRRFLTGLAALVPAVGLQQGKQPSDSAIVDRLQDPELAGKSRGPITEYDNDPFIVGIERQLRCTCGCNLSVYTCRTTDFNCDISPAMHQRVIALAKEGKTAKQILAAFVAEDGEAVLMAPPKQGFYLAGYWVPRILVALVGALIVWVLVRRTRTAPAAVTVEAPNADAGPAESDAVSPEVTERLQDELGRLGR